MREAENCFQMARYAAAARALQRVVALEPANSGAGSLRKRIEFQLSAFQSRNGTTSSLNKTNGEGAVASRGKTVLVVDQDERVLVHLAETLKKYGLRIVSALDCEEALETVESITPDLVISEVNFANGPAGYDLFSRLRARSQTRHVSFLFLATKIDREVLIAGKRLGVDDFLFKPVDGDVVAASVMNCLGRGKAT